MSTNVFTYGSLMFPQVWERVVRGRYRSAPASLSGHARFAIEDETYPGMVTQGDACVQGVVYFDVDARDLAALDDFEGSDYRRDYVVAELANGERLKVATYLYLPTQRLSDQPWHPEAFRMQRFLETYCREKLGE